MRVLVVDDELVSLKKMQKIMESIAECQTADCGKDAIDVFRAGYRNGAPFDVVTLDVSMPEMDGTEVLLEMRAIEEDCKVSRENGCKIMMVTSHSDKDTVITCVQAGCNDYIAKPFDRETVLKKLADNGIDTSGDRQQVKNRVLNSIIAKFNRGEIDLPSPPQIAVRFDELVAKGTNMQEMAELLKQDAAISSKLISVSNSAYYRGVKENHNLDQAIARLGLDTTRQTVQSIINRGMYAVSNKRYADMVEKLWMHSLSTAHIAQVVTEKMNLSLAEDAFTMGLLHDIGTLILVQVVGEMEAKMRGDTVEWVELFTTLEAYHAQTGASLLKKWQFPDIFVQVALYHDALEKAPLKGRELQVIHFSNLLSKSMGYEHGKCDEIDLDEAASTRLLGLDPTAIAAIRNDVDQRMQSLKSLLG